MNAPKFAGSWPVAALAALFAWTAAAQQEQWLSYHTSSEPHGYRWLEVSTNPPPNVALPKLRAHPVFGQWKNGLDDGRWFALDRAGKGGICDRIYFDCNGNGRLDDDAPVSAARREYMNTVFPPLKVVFKGEDGPITFHLIAHYYQFDSDRQQLLVGSGGWYEGTVNFAGKKRRVQLFDNTVNAAFNDVGLDDSDCDRVVLPGDKAIARYLGRYLELEGQFFRLEVARDGALVKVEKAEGVELGQVRVPESISEMEVIGECGHFVRRPIKGALTLPVGKYRVYEWKIERKDDQDTAWTLSGSGLGRAAEFAVTAAETTALSIGEPIRPLLEATESRSQVRFSLRMLGSLGESVEIQRGKDRPRPPRLLVASLAGSFRSTNSFEYG